MSMRLRPANLVNGFVERFLDPKYEALKSIYENDLSRWLTQRGLTKPSDITDNGKGFLLVQTLETWMATPIPVDQVQKEEYISVVFQHALEFATIHKIDIFITE